MINFYLMHELTLVESHLTLDEDSKYEVVV